MAKTRLILAEGLPCSGKSTAAKFLADTLHMQFFDEGTGHHPADWENHAFLTEAEFAALCSALPDEEDRRLICAESAAVPGGIIIPLTDALPQAQFDFLLHRKIYDFLPWETEKPLMLDKWREFAENAEGGYVFNCVFLQNPMCETMMRFDMTQAQSKAYIAEIAAIIRPLNPFVIYLKTTEPAENIRKAAPSRPGWLDAVTDYHCNGGYGKAHGLSGFDGYIAALEERQRRELAILEQLDIPHLIVTDAQKDYDAAYREMLTALAAAE